MQTRERKHCEYCEIENSDKKRKAIPLIPVETSQDFPKSEARIEINNNGDFQLLVDATHNTSGTASIKLNFCLMCGRNIQKDHLKHQTDVQKFFSDFQNHLKENPIVVDLSKKERNKK